MHNVRQVGSIVAKVSLLYQSYMATRVVKVLHMEFDHMFTVALCPRQLALFLNRKKIGEELKYNHINASECWETPGVLLLEKHHFFLPQAVPTSTAD